MGNNFKVGVNSELNFDFNRQEVKDLNVVSEANNNYHILHNNKSYKVKLIHANFNDKKYTISLDSNIFQLEISNDLDLLIDKMGYSKSSSKTLNSIFAPMPGIIIDIKVKEGDHVKEGDSLFILEAMKMENAIVSPKDTVIKSLFIKVGDAVEKGKLLIELE